MLYLFLADGFEEIEAITLLDIIRRAKLDICSISVGEQLEVTGSHGIVVKADQLLSQLLNNPLLKPQALILPGGMPGSKNLMQSETLKQLFFAHRHHAVISAICAAPMVLGEWQMLQGKRATCFPGFENQLHGATLSEDVVVKDGTFITSRGAGTAATLAFEIVAHFTDSDTALKIKSSMLY